MSQKTAQKPAEKSATKPSASAKPAGPAPPAARATAAPVAAEKPQEAKKAAQPRKKRAETPIYKFYKVEKGGGVTRLRKD